MFSFTYHLTKFNPPCSRPLPLSVDSSTICVTFRTNTFYSQAVNLIKGSSAKGDHALTPILRRCEPCSCCWPSRRRWSLASRAPTKTTSRRSSSRTWRWTWTGRMSLDRLYPDLSLDLYPDSRPDSGPAGEEASRCPPALPSSRRGRPLLGPVPVLRREGRPVPLVLQRRGGRAVLRRHVGLQAGASGFEAR